MLLWLLLAQDVSNEVTNALAWLERHPQPEGCACLPVLTPRSEQRYRLR